MFPKEMLDCELINEENSLEIYLLIRKTTPELRKKLEEHKLRSERYLELQRFIHAKSLHGQLDAAREEILSLISGQDAAKWALRDQQFKQLINQEIDLLFKEPGRIEKAINLEGNGLPEQET